MFKPAIFNIKQLRWSLIWWHVVKALDCELCSELMSINDPLCTAREWRGSAEVIRVLLFCVKHMEAGGYKNATGFPQWYRSRNDGFQGKSRSDEMQTLTRMCKQTLKSYRCGCIFFLNGVFLFLSSKTITTRLTNVFDFKAWCYCFYVCTVFHSNSIMSQFYINCRTFRFSGYICQQKY